MPALKAAYETILGQGFVVLGVNLRDRERPRQDGEIDVRDFAQRFAVDYPIGIESDGAAGRAYSVSVIPTSFLIDRQGQVREVQIGIWRLGELEALVAALQR